MSLRFVRGFGSTLVFGALLACGGGSDSTGAGGGAGGGDPYGGGGGGGGSPTCPANSVCMLSSSFSPATLTVGANTQVSFVNNSGISHDVVFDSPRPPGVDDIGQTSSGTFVRTFTTAGTFNFHCNVHAGMTGTIVVN